MEIDPQLDMAFAEEKQALEGFFDHYAETYPSIPLEHDDPDVRRLIEAMALLTARTRLAGQQQIAALHQRLFQQLSPYLLTPLPAMGLIRLYPAAMVEPVCIEKGTRVAISSVETGESAIFRTLFDMPVLPIRLARVELQDASQLVFYLQATRDLHAPIDPLSLYIDATNGYEDSLSLLQLLRQHVQQAQVFFGDDDESPLRCKVAFGAPDACHYEFHPLERERLFFHFPQQALYLHLTLPEPPRSWRRCTIVLDLDCPWPRRLRLRLELLQHCFQLFIIPVENLRPETAETVTCDGTKTRYPIHPPKQEADLALHSVRGVYQMSKAGPEPLRPGLLQGNRGSYEIEQTMDSAVGTWVAINLPEAFHQPTTVSIDALWHQPAFSASLWKQLRARPYDLNIPGLEWRVQDRFIAHANPVPDRDAEAFLKLSVLKNKPILNRDEVVYILDALSSVWQREFQSLRPLLRDLKVQHGEQRENGVAVGPKLIYTVAWQPFDERLQPLVDTFMAHLGRILDVWIAEAKVEVRLEVLAQSINPTRKASTSVS